MQYSQEHLKTMVYAKFGGQTDCIMGNWKIENKEERTNELNVTVAESSRMNTGIYVIPVVVQEYGS